MIPVAAAGRSFVGGRQANEDRVVIAQRDTTWCLVVSDGAGGHAGGAIAAQTAVDRIVEGFHARPPDGAEDLSELLLDAHDAVLAAQQVGAGSMHATVVALVIDASAGLAFWGHVGDSRLYVLREGRVAGVTRDDSVVQWMVTSGYIDAESAATHPQKNRLLAALGVEGDLHPSVSPAPRRLAAGDAFLLCTDGWWDLVEEAEIERALASAGSVEAWMDTMAGRVAQLASPDHDNYSAIGCWIGDRHAAAPPR